MYRIMCGFSVSIWGAGRWAGGLRRSNALQNYANRENYGRLAKAKFEAAVGLGQYLGIARRFGGVAAGSGAIVARPVYTRRPAEVRSSPDRSTPVARSGDDGADASKNALPLSRDGVRQGCEWVVAVGDTAIRGRGSAAAWALQGLSAWPCGPRTRCKSLRRNRPRRCLRRQGCGYRCGRGTSGRG